MPSWKRWGCLRKRTANRGMTNHKWRRMKWYVVQLCGDRDVFLTLAQGHGTIQETDAQMTRHDPFLLAVFRLVIQVVNAFWRSQPLRHDKGKHCVHK